jgi:hypothetical protein
VFTIAQASAYTTEATVSVKATADAPPPLVAAVSVAVVLPTSTVHTGTFAVTQIAELGVMVMVSDTPPAPAAPVLRAPLAEGVKTNLCLIGAMPSVSWLNDVAERDATCVAETCSGAMQTKRRIDCANVQRTRPVLIGPGIILRETVFFATTTSTAPAAETERRISTAKYKIHSAVRMAPIDAAHVYVRILQPSKSYAKPVGVVSPPSLLALPPDLSSLGRAPDSESRSTSQC